MPTDTTDLLLLLSALAVLCVVVFGFGDWPLRRELTLMDFVLLALGVRATFKGILGESPAIAEGVFVVVIATLHLGVKLVRHRSDGPHTLRGSGSERK